MSSSMRFTCCLCRVLSFTSELSGRTCFLSVLCSWPGLSPVRRDDGVASGCTGTNRFLQLAIVFQRDWLLCAEQVPSGGQHGCHVSEQVRCHFGCGSAFSDGLGYQWKELDISVGSLVSCSL